MYKTFTNYNGTSSFDDLNKFFNIYILFITYIFGERSVWKIFELKSQISNFQEEYAMLEQKKIKYY